MSHLAEGDDVLHHADGRHLAKPPEGTADRAEWIRRLRHRLARHGHKIRNSEVSPWETGRQVPGNLRTDQAEPGS